MKEINKIYNEDCLIGMQEIDDKSIDCIICDLPYGVLNKNNANAKWDSVIPFDKLWNQYNRIIKDNGAIILFASGMFTANLMMSQPNLWRYNLIWDKVRTSGFLNSHKMPLRSHEDICVFYKKMPTYNPQMVKATDANKTHSRGKNKEQTNRCYGDYDFVQSNQEVKFPKSIITIEREHKDFYHPTQKPVKLIEWLIKSYTNEGDLILDNCMGSGTTAVAAINTNRNFIGFELEEKYFNIASDRIYSNLLNI